MSKIIFSDDALAMAEYLKRESKNSKKERMILNALQKKIEIITKDYHYGDSVPKKLIPDYYKKKYSIKNLFRVELPCFWRFLYTVKNDDIEIIAFVIDITDHEKYDRLFGYRKK